tara:strand:- start:555 stop:908 length:354 start_codon:yes stop_codon:yes gene_type:complete
MESHTIRILAFLIGCIGIRLLFALTAKFVNINYLPYLGYIALLPAIGMLFIYLTGSRDYGIEAGGKIWWNDLRPLHSLLYFLFAYNAIIKNQTVAWKILLADVIIGLFAFINHRFLK